MQQLVTGSSVEATGVVNNGVAGGQERVYIPHSRSVHRIKSLTMQEADTTSSAYSMVGKIRAVGVPVNYVALSGSLRGAPVYLRIASEMTFAAVNGVLYPEYDFWNPGTIGTTVYRLPTQQAYEFALAIWFPGMTLGYVDGAVLEYGYLPDTLERSL